MTDIEIMRYFLEQGRKAQEAVDEILKPRTLPIPSPQGQLDFSGLMPWADDAVRGSGKGMPKTPRRRRR